MTRKKRCATVPRVGSRMIKRSYKMHTIFTEVCSLHEQSLQQIKVATLAMNALFNALKLLTHTTNLLSTLPSNLSSTVPSKHNENPIVSFWLAFLLWDPGSLSAKWIVLLEAHQLYLWAVSTWQFDSHFKAISEHPRGPANVLINSSISLLLRLLWAQLIWARFDERYGLIKI